MTVEPTSPTPTSPSARAAKARRLLTNSLLTAHRACPHKAHLGYGLGVRPVKMARPLVFGDAGHKALERYWRARLRREADPAVRLREALDGIPEGADLDPYERAKLVALVTGYCLVWDQRQVEVLAVEAEVAWPLVHPDTGKRSAVWDQAGKMDVLVYLPRLGKVAVIEHKFSAKDAQPGSEYRARLAIDGQCDQYLQGSRAAGHPADLVIYDVVLKPAIRPLAATPEEKCWREVPPAAPLAPRSAAAKARDAALVAAGVLGPVQGPPERVRVPKTRLNDETPAEYYARLVEKIAARPADFYQWVQVVRSPDARRAYALDVWAWGRIIAGSDAAGLWPRNPDACKRYHVPCEYWRVCTETASIDDPTLFRRATSVHEELSLEDAPPAA